MKLHDLKPAPGSRHKRTRVGRGIAAGQGKTAGRGTKGQKARAGGTIPPWFEGGQTPIHVRVPKLRGFKNRFKVEYQVVNVGQISAYAEAGRFGVELEQPKAKGKGKADDQPVPTVNAEVLAQAGLIRGDDKPLKVLGQGEVSQKLFVAADAFSGSARRKIEQAGGFVQLLREPAKGEPSETATADVEPATSASEPVAHAAAPEASTEQPAAPAAKPARKSKAAVPAAESAAPAEESARAAESAAPAAESAAPAEKAPAAKPRRRAAKSDENA
jgi:large subunit ribosomal protein L15